MTLDGIPVGTLRSNLGDAKVTSEDWCRIFGHKYIGDRDGNIYCKSCFKSLDEINKEVYAKGQREAGNTAGE